MTDENSGASRRKPFWAISVTPARQDALIDEIVAGSAPRPLYYILLGISTLIAGFGLLTNSPAVVIGAMLVSPLMMPIFGVSLGLARTELPLLRNALIAEFGGVALAILLAFLLGLLPLSFTNTPEMLARTSPTLMDLFVAALAGLAGCLAMIDERISPALPGVAIATALTPPLATCGLSLASGEFAGAWGAFLLFFANFLAILAVSTVIFMMAGFVTIEQVGSAGDLTRRYGAALIGLLVVTFLLTQQLVWIVKYRRTTQTVSRVLTTELAHEPNATVMDILHDREDGRLRVLSVLRTAEALSPRTVQDIEEVLARELEEPVDLFFRCSITKDIAATGSAYLLAQRNLDGHFTDRAPSSEARILQVAEQTIRDRLVNVQSMRLESIDLLQMPVGPVVIASVQTPFRILGLHVKSVEDEIRNRLGDSTMRLVIRSVLASNTTSQGTVLIGRAHFDDQTPDEAAMARTLEVAARTRLEAIPDVLAPDIDIVREDEHWNVRADVYGPRAPTPGQVRAIEQALTSLAEEPVAITLRARSDIIVTGDRYRTSDDLVTELTWELRRAREGQNAEPTTER